MPQSDRNAPQRYALIDGLRGLAAFAILLFHYRHFGMTGVDRAVCGQCIGFEPGRGLLWPLYEYGHVAVQVFWAISGFVFASAYFGREVSAREFWVNRIARLYPLHLLTLFAVVGLQAVALATLGTTLIYGGFDAAHFGLQLVLASNWVDARVHTFNGPIWSVSVEVLVYALFWGLRRNLQRMGAAAFVSLVLLCLVATIFAGAWQVPLCAFFFFAGVGLARVRHRLPPPSQVLAMTAIALVVLATMAVRLDQPLLGTISGVVAIVGSIACLAQAERLASRPVRKAACWMGDCTYGLYLWHVPVQLALLLAIGPGERMVQLAGQGWFALAWLAGMVMLARLSFRWFEAPARAWVRQRWYKAPEPGKKEGDMSPGFA